MAKLLICSNFNENSVYADPESAISRQNAAS
jgi:hypothetical protein